MNRKKKIHDIMKISIPLMIQGLVFQLQSLTDKAFLGNLDTRFVSAVGAAQMPYFAMSESMVAICLGVAIITANLVGAGKKDGISRYVKSASFFGTILGLGLFFFWMSGAHSVLAAFKVDEAVIGYGVQYIQICAGFFLVLGIDAALQAALTGQGETKIIMYAGMLKVGLNIVLSWILIFGHFGFPALNVAGAAIGTLLSNLFSFFCLLIYCCHKKKEEFKLFVWDKEYLDFRTYGQMIKLGIPAGMEVFLWHGSNLILVRFINSFSYLDMAVYTLVFGMQCFVIVFFGSNSKAAMTLIGQCIGAGEGKRADRYFNITLVLNLLMISIFTLCFFLFPERLLHIFSGDEEVLKTGVFYLKLAGVIVFPQSMNILCGNAIRAHGDTKWMLYSQILGSIEVVGLSVVFIEWAGMGIISIYITLFLDEAIRGSINYFYYKKKYGKAEGVIQGKTFKSV